MVNSIRLCISVEGTSEEKFVESVLAPYLSKQNIHLTPLNLSGGISLKTVTAELTHHAKNFDYVTTLYDFYGFQDKGDLDKSALEAQIKASLPAAFRGKVLPYIQMYEFEGLLFSCPKAMKTHLRMNRSKANKHDVASWAKSVLKNCNFNPEQVNDSQTTAPSKRLETHTNFIKTVHGPDIAKDIGIDVIRQKCAGFNAWMHQLEQLSPS